MYDNEIEKAILYYMIFQEEEFNITEVDFVNVVNQKIIKAINELKARKEEVSILAISTKVKDEKDIINYIATLDDYIATSTPETIYKILKEYTKKRQAFRLSREIQETVKNAENIDIYIEKIIKQLQNIEFQTEKEVDFKEQIIKTIQDIENNINKTEDRSLYTGYFDLDSLTDGLHNGEFTVIGARPGVGKTTFALQLGENISEKGKKVVYVSLEMSEEQLIQKIISKITRINSRKIRNGDLEEKQLIDVSEACVKISELPISILTKANTIQQIEIEARRMKNRNELDLLIIDYLQLLRNVGSFKNREQEVANISRTLKLLSLELNIPIIALCQLNRNASKNEPTLADIRESGALEQDADNVIFIYSENEEEDIVTVDLQKQRTGNTGRLKLKFYKQYSEFINLER